MTPTLSVEVDPATTQRLVDQIHEAQARLNMEIRPAMAWAGALAAQSLGAQTIVSPKKRKVIDLPIQRVTKGGKADRRYSPFGVEVWIKGEKKIRPIYRFGTHGVWRYQTKAQAAQNWKTKIGRSGLAKQSWKWNRGAIEAAVSGGGSVLAAMRIPKVSEVDWFGEVDAPELRITNNLKYIEFALRGGRGAVDTALGKAANKLEHEIERRAALALTRIA